MGLYLLIWGFHFTRTIHFLPVKLFPVLYRAASMLLVLVILTNYLHQYGLCSTHRCFISLSERDIITFGNYNEDHLNADLSTACFVNNFFWKKENYTCKYGTLSADIMILCWQDSVGVVPEHRLVHPHTGHGHVQRDPSLRNDQWHILQVRLTCNLSLDSGL